MIDNAFFGRGLLAGVLLLALLSKLGTAAGRLAFLAVIDELSPWPPRRSGWLAAGTVAVEVAVAAALLAPVVTAAVALTSAILLLLAFTLVLFRLLGSGTSTGCACFGAWSDGRIGPTAVGRNLALIAVALISLGRSGGSGSDAPLAAVVGLVCAAAAGLLVRAVPVGSFVRSSVRAGEIL